MTLLHSGLTQFCVDPRQKYTGSPVNLYQSPVFEGKIFSEIAEPEYHFLA